MKLPCTLLRRPLILTPLLSLPEMTLRSANVAPPIVLSSEERIGEKRIKTPSRELPRSTLPVTSVPMKLPTTRFSPPVISTPFLPLPEMTLRAPAVVPPIVLPPDRLMRTPSPELLGVAVPAALVPMKLPSIIERPQLEPIAVEAIDHQPPHRTTPGGDSQPVCINPCTASAQLDKRGTDEARLGGAIDRDRVSDIRQGPESGDTYVDRLHSRSDAKINGVQKARVGVGSIDRL